MKPIVPVQAVVTANPSDIEPSDAELAVIEREMPAIRAAVELLDVRIALLDRPVSEVDARRVRRAENRLLAERARLATAARELPEVTA